MLHIVHISIPSVAKMMASYSGEGEVFKEETVRIGTLGRCGVREFTKCRGSRGARWDGGIFTKSLRTKFAKCTQMYSTV
jgi:hypothetical protein